MTKKERKILVRMIVNGEAEIVERNGKLKPKSRV